MPALTCCPHCGHAGNVPSAHLGKKARCPKCGKPFILWEAKSETPAPSVPVPPFAAEAVEGPALSHRALESKAEPVSPLVEVSTVAPINEVDCPFCGESIKQSAKKCRHCGETVDVALRAAQEAQRTAEKAGRRQRDDRAVIHIHAPSKSKGTAALLEVLGGLFQVFGIGHLYAGNVLTGLLFMFGYWMITGVNIVLCFVLIGFFTWPLCWVGTMILSPILASASVSED